MRLGANRCEAQCCREHGAEGLRTPLWLARSVACSKLKVQMKTIRTTVTKQFARIILCWLAAACLCALPVFAQPSPSAVNAGGNGTAAGIRGITILDGQWRFQAGDDLRWADPAFDDSSWPMVSLSSSLVEQGIDSYSGYGMVPAEASAAAGRAIRQPCFGRTTLPAGCKQLHRPTRCVREWHGSGPYARE